MSSTTGYKIAVATDPNGHQCRHGRSLPRGSRDSQKRLAADVFKRHTGLLTALSVSFRVRVRVTVRVEAKVAADWSVCLSCVCS